jgi:hypothetical protein
LRCLRHHGEFTQVAAIRARLDPQVLEKADLVNAKERLRQLHGDLVHEALLSVDLLEAKLAWGARARR